jgi:hypothetical protein
MIFAFYAYSLTFIQLRGLELLDPLGNCLRGFLCICTWQYVSVKLVIYMYIVQPNLYY